MGARDFSSFADGATAKAAFQNAREQAIAEHGNRRNGTVSEKSDFVMVDKPAHLGDDERAILRHAFGLLSERDDIDDKYGPAGCIQVKPGRFLFFGMAPD